MKEYIERNEAIAALTHESKKLLKKKDYNTPYSIGEKVILNAKYKFAIDRLKGFPSVPVAPVRRGKWFVNGNYRHCSECNARQPYDVTADVIEFWPCNFCPSCGANMTESEEY